PRNSSSRVFGRFPEMIRRMVDSASALEYFRAETSRSLGNILSLLRSQNVLDLHVIIPLGDEVFFGAAFDSPKDNRVRNNFNRLDGGNFKLIEAIQFLGFFYLIQHCLG